MELRQKLHMLYQNWQLLMYKQHTTDGYLAYGDMDDFNRKVENSVVTRARQTDGLTEVIAGVDYKLTDKINS